MKYEVVWVYTQEVAKVFDNEDDAWKWIRNCGDHADLYDVNYVDED